MTIGNKNSVIAKLIHLKITLAQILALSLVLSVSIGAFAAPVRIPNLPAEPPSYLNETARKVWLTLITGQPQWQNWPQLLYGSPASKEVSDAMVAVAQEVDKRTQSIQTRMRRQLGERIYAAEIQNPYSGARKVDLSEPRDAILNSFDQTLSRKSEPIKPAMARLLAQNEFMAKHGLTSLNNLDPQQRNELYRLEQQFERREQLRKTNDMSAESFARWKSFYLTQIDDQLERDRLTILKEFLRNPYLRRYIQYIVIGPGRSLKDARPIAEIYGDGTGFENSYNSDNHRPVPEYLDKAAKQLNTQGHYDDSTILITDHPKYGPLALSLEWGMVGKNYYHHNHFDSINSIYDLKDVANLRVEGLYGWIRYRAQLIEASVKKIKWEGDVATTRASIVAAAQPKKRSEVLNVSSWFVTYLNDQKRHEDYSYLDFQVVGWLDDPGTSIYTWQYLKRGPEYWREREDIAKRSNLPRLVFNPPQDNSPEAEERRERQKKQAEPNTVYIGQRAYGNFGEPKKLPLPLSLIPLQSNLTVDRVRIADSESLTGMVPFQTSNELGAWRLLTQASIGKNVSKKILALPSPEGFEPTISNAFLQYKTKQSVKTLQSDEIKFIYDPIQRTYAIDLRQFPSIVDIMELRIDFARSTQRLVPQPLVFTSEQLLPVIQNLEQLGAHALAQSLLKAKSLTASEIAARVAASSCYSLGRKNLKGHDLSDFVRDDGRFHIQCTMAQTLLETILTSTLENHSMKDRVTFGSISQFGIDKKASGDLQLGFPLHAVLEYSVDSIPAEVLDATPVLERRPTDKEVIKARPKLHAVLEALNKSRAEILAAMNVVKPKLSEIPIPRLNAAFKATVSLGQLVQSKSTDEKEFRLQAASVLNLNADNIPLLQLAEMIETSIHSWSAEVTVLARSLRDANPQIRAEAQRNGAYQLLNPLILSPVEASTHHAGSVLKQCEEILNR
jgi:hypothetical protein